MACTYCQWNRLACGKTCQSCATRKSKPGHVAICFRAPDEDTSLEEFLTQNHCGKDELRCVRNAFQLNSEAKAHTLLELIRVSTMDRKFHELQVQYGLEMTRILQLCIRALNYARLCDVWKEKPTQKQWKQALDELSQVYCKNKKPIEDFGLPCKVPSPKKPRTSFCTIL